VTQCHEDHGGDAQGQGHAACSLFFPFPLQFGPCHP
jgi:hypothetical protein